jgi:undecaprenyl-phosphate galactose phosphotransferase/putative colanic acid biosynthesis UDP-glucose lipid carrier transferase
MEQAQPRADNLFSSGAVPAGASDGTRNIRTPPRVEPRIPVSAPAKDRATATRGSTYWIAIHDLHSPVQIVADSLVIVALSVLTGVAYHEAVSSATDPTSEFAGTGLIVALLFAGIIRLVDGRHAAALTTRFDRLRDAALVWSLTFAALVFFLFVFKAGGDFSRGAVLTFYLVGLFAMGFWRAFSPPTLTRIAHNTGYAKRECIVIGDDRNHALDGLAAELAASGHPTPTIIKFRAGCDGLTWPQEQKNLIARSIKAAHELRHGEIYLCAAGVSVERLASIQRSLDILPRAIYVIPDADVAALVKNKISTIGTHVAVEVRREPLNSVQRTIKRLVDVFLASLALLCLAPFFGVTAIAIKWDSSGPVFFRQTRNGYRGKPFKMFKFRTMHVQEDGPVVRQASRNDARVTRVGRFLRQSSIDELPQLLNVLTGQMSLVGPRPHARAHDELYAKAIENYEIRQHVKPGITGWAQVHGLRGETAELDQMYRRIEYDLWYAVNASLLLDAEILVRTIFEVFRRRNAY